MKKTSSNNEKQMKIMKTYENHLQNNERSMKHNEKHLENNENK